MRPVQEQLAAEVGVDRSDEVGWHVHELRFEPGERRDRLGELVPAQNLVGGDVEALTQGVRVGEQPCQAHGEVVGMRHRPESSAVARHDELLPATQTLDDRVVHPVDRGRDSSLAVGVGRPDDRERKARLGPGAVQALLAGDLAERVVPAGAAERRALDERERRRLRVDGRRTDEDVLGDAREQFECRLDVLRRESDPVDDHVEALVAESRGHRGGIANIGLERPADGAPSAAQHGQIDLLRRKQASSRGADVPGAAYEEDAHAAFHVRASSASSSSVSSPDGLSAERLAITVSG